MKLQEFADDNFYFHVNGGKFSIGVENTMGKSEILTLSKTTNFELFKTEFADDFIFIQVVESSPKGQIYFGKFLIFPVFSKDLYG